MLSLMIAGRRTSASAATEVARMRRGAIFMRGRMRTERRVSSAHLEFARGSMMLRAHRPGLMNARNECSIQHNSG